MTDLNGSRPSPNGRGAESNAAADAPQGVEVTLFVADRLDALERALGTVRRRGMTIRIQSLVRRDGELAVVFRAEPNAVVPERWIAELGALVDVRQVKVAGLPAPTR